MFWAQHRRDRGGCIGIGAALQRTSTVPVVRRSQQPDRGMIQKLIADADVSAFGVSVRIQGGDVAVAAEVDDRGGGMVGVQEAVGHRRDGGTLSAGRDIGTPEIVNNRGVESARDRCRRDGLPGETVAVEERLAVAGDQLGVDACIVYSRADRFGVDVCQHRDGIPDLARCPPRAVRDGQQLGAGRPQRSRRGSKNRDRSGRAGRAHSENHGVDRIAAGPAHAARDDAIVGSLGTHDLSPSSISFQ